MLKKKSYSHYTKKELIEELHLMIDNCNSLEWQINNQAKYINQNYIPIEWMKKFAYERALNDGEDDYWHFWGTDLLQMIDQWEKENEAN